ncbi:MAG: penicillin-binding transpeptidase domain-containing protein [Actinomycetota bacterium]|nr:penicillin-binding transpeptidase domain-containing protein [Actinomycetota bacterium]
MEGDALLNRRQLMVLAALGLAFAAVLVVIVRTLSAPDPADAANKFFAAIEAAELESAAALTNGDADLVTDQLQANIDGLDGAELDATVEEVEQEGETAEATVRMAWEVPEIGAFTYVNRRVPLIQVDGDWLINWSATVIHPDLTEDGERLGTTEEFPERAPILDRNGAELVALRPVVEVGVVPKKLEDAGAAITAIVESTDTSGKTLRASIEKAEPGSFVPAITLREDEFAAVEGTLSQFEGIEFGNRELPLAPTRDFARALLGSVGPVTAEQLEESQGELDVDDVVGQSGLQEAFEEELAGTPERSVVIRNAKGVPVEKLETVDGASGEPVKTTLDMDIQSAAEEALAEQETAALIAIEPSTGNILAVANRPTEDGFNRALAGRYAPGSTFKVISTAALLADGLDPAETVECPESIEAGGREFVNFEGSAAGAVPFSTDFAQSCNTAFVSLADRLDDAALKDTATMFGLGRSYDLGVDSFAGDVPRSRDDTEQAAAMIGQARILASPLAMAGVVATVVDGTWRQPRLLDEDPSEEGEAIESEALDALRVLMRSVITSGTGTALASVPGEPIGKSGTAEYEDGDPPPTHGWFIAGREDIAVAVIVEDAASGGEFAAPVAASFLSAVEAAPLDETVP